MEGLVVLLECLLEPIARSLASRVGDCHFVEEEHGVDVVAAEACPVLLCENASGRKILF